MAAELGESEWRIVTEDGEDTDAVGCETQHAIQQAVEVGVVADVAGNDNAVPIVLGRLCWRLELDLGR